jgi:FHS family L-fucose permease-like MFS transporter
MTTPQPPASTQQRSAINPIIILGALFFVFGFITWLNSVLIPYLKMACELNNFEAYLVTSAFYISYLVMGVPAARLLKKTGFKKGMSAGLVIMAVGALVFIPAAETRTYALFLLGLFVQGTGLTVLQAASNPYITIVGDRESAAKRISIMGICNKVAGVIAPIVLGSVVLKDADVLVKRLKSMATAQKVIELNNLASKVIMPYIVILVSLLMLAILIYFSSLPAIDTDHEDETLATANVNKKSITQFPHLMLGVVTLFFCVGVEVIAGDTIIRYGAAQGIPLATAKFFTSCTLGAMVAGYIVGIIAIPRYIKQDKAFSICAVLGVLFSIAAICTTSYTSIMFIALLGLANSLMWPAVWPLAIADLGRFTKIGSSLLIMGIAGGAVLPLLYGRLTDMFNARAAYSILIPCYLFIWYYATAGHKIRKWAKA